LSSDDADDDPLETPAEDEAAGVLDEVRAALAALAAGEA